MLRELHKDKTPEGVARYENVEELLAGMKEFSDAVDPANPDALRTMGDFLVDVAFSPMPTRMTGTTTRSP